MSTLEYHSAVTVNCGVVHVFEYCAKIHDQQLYNTTKIRSTTVYSFSALYIIDAVVERVQDPTGNNVVGCLREESLMSIHVVLEHRRGLALYLIGCGVASHASL